MIFRGKYLPLLAVAGLAAVVSTALAAQYLPPTYTNTGLTGDWCENIQINTAPPFNSGTILESASDYNYHMGVGATFTPGTSYTMTVLNNGLYDGGISAWLDLNGDGDYSDANEFLGSTPVLPQATSGTINFTVPVSNPSQPATRFRVIQAYNVVPTDPVGNYSFGQCEEYDATIVPLGDPEIQVKNPSSVVVASTTTTNLGNTDTGGPTNYTFTVENVGATNPLTVTSIACAPSGVGNVTVTPSPALTPASPVPAQGSATFTVAVTPTAVGPYEFTITINNNDVDEGTYTVIVQGTGADPNPAVQAPVPATANSPILITEWSEDPGTSGDEYIELTNVSGAPFDMTGWQLVFYLASTTPSYTLTLTAGTLAPSTTWVICDNPNPLTANPPANQYCGQNMSSAQNAGLVLLDASNNIMDAAFFGTMNPAGITTPVSIGSEWVGATAANPTFSTDSAKRTGTSDHNDASDWSTPAASGDSLNVVNTGLTLPFSMVGGATLGGADPAWTGGLQIGDALDVTFIATDSNPAQTLNFTITVTGGTLTAAQAGFIETFPYTPAGGVSPHSVMVTGTAAMAGTIQLTVQVSDGTLTDTITYSLTIAPAPEMDVLRAATPVADGGTDTVDILQAGSDLIYTIQNTGGLDLNLTGTPLVQVTAGTNVNTVNVTANPTTPIAGAGSTNFTINVVPTGAGTYSFTVSIANNDPNENPYNFTVSGNVLVNLPPVVTNQAGSNWVDAGGGLFTLTVNPGATINDSLEATDATPDNMTVTVTNPASALTGLTSQPTDISTPTAGPISLTWTGTADASNIPGNFDWLISIDDGSSTVNITARIIVVDVPPQHAILNATGGDGSAGTPYTATFAVANTAANSVDLATVTDGNTGQIISISGTPNQTSGPTGGTGFTFSLTGGILSVAPAGTLVAADAGIQVFDVVITDGNVANDQTVTVSLDVLSNIPPAVGVGTSNWVDAGGGLFTLTVNPGAAINDSLEATDANLDNMTVTVTNPVTALAGLTAQPASNPTPTAGPISLTWTGTSNGSNAPGNYDWAIDINDGTSTTSITARIIVVDVAPQHTAATGVTGDGSVATPYLATYVQNDPVTLSVNLANVTDGNTGQTLTLSNVAQTAGPSGSGFTFSLTGGVLSVAPTATLVAADVGVQDFSMDVDDGTNTVTINVSITVMGASGAITFTNTSPLPSGTVGAAYTTVTLTATGGTGPYTYSVISGSLPAGLTLSPAGDITGTPTVAVVANFTVRAVDSLNDTGTGTFALTINGTGSSSGSGSDSGGGGCAAESSSNMGMVALLALLGMVGLAVRLRRKRA